MKKLITLFILSSLLLQLAACGSGSESGKTPPPDDMSSDVSTTEEETTNYLTQYSDIDFEGATYTFGTTSDAQYPNYIGDDLNGESVNDAQYHRDTWIESNYNVSLEYIKYDDAGKLTQAIRTQVMAGDNTLDCVENGMATNLAPLSSEGMLANLRAVEGLDLEASWWSQSMNKEFTINDKLYTTTGPIAFSYYYSPRLVAYNLRLADEYNLDNLYEVVEDGKWTIDYMYNSMKSVTHDLNGDGEMGEDDMWGASVDEYSAAGFYISAGGTQTAITSDGSPTFLFDNSDNYARIEKVASIIGNAEVTQKAEKLASRSGSYNILDKVYTFKNGHALYLGYGAQAIAFYLRDMEDDYGILPVPKYDESQKEYITFGNAYVPAYVALPANNNRGKINGIILDSMGYISQRDVQPLVASVTLKGKAARDEGSLKMIDIIYEDTYLDLNSCYDFGGSFTLLRDITMGKLENFSSKWESKKTKATSDFEKLLEQFSAID